MSISLLLYSAALLFSGLPENHFADPSQALPKAIDQANTQTWRVIELSLAGDSMMGWLKGKIAGGVERGVLNPLKEWVQAQGEEFRLACVSELRAARLAGRLNRIGNSQEIATAGDAFKRCTAPGALLERTRVLMVEVAADLTTEYPNLARFLADSEGHAGSLLVGAFGYFLRQAVLDQPKLRDALQFEMLSQVWHAQAHGWEALGQLLTQQGAALATELERIATEQAELKAMLRQVLERLPAEARQGSVTPRLSASLRSVDDIKLLEELERRIQAIPTAQRTPAMLDVVGRLAMAVGVFPRAEEHFREAARLSPQASAQAEACYNSYRALLEQKRWDDALAAFLAAARLDPERFALFPLTKYTPQRILGAGGFGVAFLCEHAYLRRRLVIKSFHTEALERGFEEIFREGELLSNLRHPAIIQILDGGYTNEAQRQRPYLALEYFDAPTLDAYLAQYGCLSLEQSVNLARQMAEALKTAHDQNILHRDLKPDNLLVRLAGNSWEIKIIDFGLAVTSKVVAESAAAGSLGQSLQGESLGGTYLYSAPEQLGLVAGKIGPWSDIYAFGKTLSQALFSTTQPSRKNYRVLGNHPLADLLSDCLEQVPRDRPQHFREVLDTLDEMDSEKAIRRKKEEEAARKEKEEALRKQKAAEEESIRKKKSAEEEAARKEEEALRKQKAAEEEFIRKKKSAEEESARKEREEALRKQKAAEEESIRKKKAAEEEAARKEEDALRKNALIVAPKGGQYTSINAALKAAASGATILVKPGIYRESLRISRPVQIIGDGPQGDIIIESNSSNCILMDTTNALVRGFTLRCTVESEEDRFYGVNIPIGELVLQNCDISSDSLACVAIHGTNAKPILRDCKIHDGKQGGVHVYENGAGTIERCDIFGNARAGIGIREGGNPTVRECKIHDGKSAGVYVNENGAGTIDRCDIFGNAISEIGISEGGSPTVRDCKIHDGKEGGVHVYENGVGTIERCDIFGNSRAGIEIKQGGNPTVRDCKIHDGEGSGIYVYENGVGTIERCDIFGNALVGIGIREGGNLTMRDCKIHDGLASGVSVYESGGGTIEHCDIFGNAFLGIEIHEGSNSTVRNCKIHDCKIGGVWVLQNGGGTIECCDIFGNHVGIGIKKGGNPTVRDCTIRKNGSVAIRVKGSGTVENCDLRGNKDGAWDIEAGCQVTQRNNKV